MTQDRTTTLAVVILTHNEEVHIERCLQSIRTIADEIHVVDSGSTDRTRELAAAMGARVYSNPWKNYATQLNWALDNCEIRADWVMRLDCDEYLSPQLTESIEQFKRAPHEESVRGLYVARLMIFKEQPIRWGGCYPVYVLRLWRRGSARCEERWMDEHMVLDHGRCERIRGDLVDHNLNHIGWWVNKHNNYATREAIDLLNIRHQWAPSTPRRGIGSVRQAQWKRFLKESVYRRMPLGLRAIIYFLYRYLFQLGFLDGSRGFVFHFMQGLWYRTLVDVKQAEIESFACAKGVSIPEAIFQLYGTRV